MTYTITHLRQLPSQLLPALARLHAATIPTLLTDLGQPVVLRYYQLAQKTPPSSPFALSPNLPIPLSLITLH